MLTEKAATGVIKLIPKNYDILLLLNWRSLTMLMLTEKICAKLLANRFKGPMSIVIDP